MADPFAVLGLGHDADERAIKRAYALRLRSTRPESDPAGFHTLNEAYRLALDWARERAADADVAVIAQTQPLPEATAADEAAPPAAIDADDVSSPQAPPAQVAWVLDGATLRQLTAPPHGADVAEIRWDDEAPPARSAASTPQDNAAAHEHFDFTAFFAALCDEAASGDADALQHWLQRQPALWSLATKARAGQATMAALHAQAPPMPERCFDVVLAFFDMDHVLAGQDPLRLGRLRTRLHVEWLLLDRRELAASLQAAQVPLSLSVDRLFRLLSGPFRWPGVLLQALPPGRPSEVTTFLRHLQQARVERLPPAFDRRRIAFWLRAGDRDAITLPRMAVGFARCIVLLLAAMALDGVRSVTGSLTMPLTYVMLLGCAIWALYVGWTALSRWQSQPQEAATASVGFWTRLLFIPALCLLACALRYGLPTAAGGEPASSVLIGTIALVVLAIVLALVRYRRRAGSGPWLAGGYWRWAFIVAAMRGIAAIGAFFVYYAAAGATLALAIWLADLVKQRARLRA